MNGRAFESCALTDAVPIMTLWMEQFVRMGEFGAPISMDSLINRPFGGPGSTAFGCEKALSPCP
jgi:hypothetical protein